MKGPHIVYVIRSESNPARYYTGITSNLARRLDNHNAGSTVSTIDARPWQLVVAIEFGDPARASAFERYLKSGSGRAFSLRHFR